MKWLILIFLLVCIPFVTSNDDYVARWTFDNNTNDIKNIRNATSNSNYFSIGKWGSSIWLDGIDQHINISNPSNWNLQNFTISIWFLTNYSKNGQDIISRNGDSDFIRFDLNGNKFYPQLVLSNGTSYGGNSNTAWTNLYWIHWVAVRNTTHFTIFINGTEDTTAKWEVPYTLLAKETGTFPLKLGIRNTNTFLNGSIDEFRIYNRSLSYTEISSLYLYNNETYCALTNTSWSEWTNETDCLDNEHLHRHRNRTTYATVCTYSYTNVGFTEEQDIDCALIESQKINNNLIKIYGVFTMIAGILLFLGLWFLAYHMIQTGNMYMGWGMLLLSIPLDIFLSVMFQESNFLGSGFLGIAFSVMAVFTLPAMILIKRKVKII